MVPSELGDQNSKGWCQWKQPIFSERLKAIHPVVKALGRFLLTGWQAGRPADKNLLVFKTFKIRYQAK